MLFVAGTRVVFGIIHLKASKNATFVAVQRQRWEAELLDDANFKADRIFARRFFVPFWARQKAVFLRNDRPVSSV